MLTLDRVPVDISMESYDCCCTTFFTKTIPECFENAWNAVAEWIDLYVLPFFEACRVWFEENAVWIWPVVVIFVGITAIGLGIAFACFAPLPSPAKDEAQEYFEDTEEEHSHSDSDESHTDQRLSSTHTIQILPPRTPPRDAHNSPLASPKQHQRNTPSPSHGHEGHTHGSQEESDICSWRKTLRTPIFPTFNGSYCQISSGVDPNIAKQAIASLFEKQKSSTSNSPTAADLSKLQKLRNLINQLDDVTISIETPPSSSTEAEALIQQLEKELQERHATLEKVLPDSEQYAKAMEQKRLIDEFEF